MDDWDPHVILGVAHDATRDDIRSAYRRLALLYHPDTNRDDEQAGKRFRMVQRAYRSLSNPDIEDPPPAPARPPPTRQPTRQPTPPPASADAPAQTRKPRLRVVRAEVELRRVLRPGAVYLDIPGVGRAAVKIPAGADTGTLAPAIVRDGGAVQRLAVELRVRSDPRFRRRGLDLVTRYRIDARTAWRGTSTAIRTPWGRISVSIPARSRWGDVVRIPCKGIMGKNGWGSLFVELSRH
jgi:DnaJ-class molecular chaperone